jgi:hypothetical protein
LKSGDRLGQEVGPDQRGQVCVAVEGDEQLREVPKRAGIDEEAPLPSQATAAARISATPAASAWARTKRLKLSW